MLFASLQTLRFDVINADGIELRLDCLARIDKQEISAFCKRVSLPKLFTLRKKTQGGAFTGTEEQRLEILEDLLSLGPSYVDIEYDTNPIFIERIAKRYPQVRIILSYHHFTETPEDLSSILSLMRSPFAYAYKIAAMARTTCDALRMLLWVREQKNIRLSGIGMGSEGQITRILGPVFGNFIDYAPLEEMTAPGQITISELHSLYHYSLLNPSTELYGLIGDPIEGSRSHWTHNAVMREQQWNAVYVKMRVVKEELSHFLSLAKACGFLGLSVTMPLKEQVFPFLEHMDEDVTTIKAANTLCFLKTHLYGYNADGKGALDALETKGCVKGKRIVLLGAGGAARAIAFEAKRRGASLIILNRTKERALALAKDLDCRAGGLEDFQQEKYDIVINATPDPLPIDPAFLIPCTIAMDIKNRPNLTAFLQAAQKKGCILVFGYEMFMHQAAQQFRLWFKINVYPESVVKHYNNQLDP